MIRGTVLPSGEAVVAVKIRGPNGQVAQIETLVDTGFNDQMTLPPWVVEMLALAFRHEASYTFADGVKSATRVFEGEIEWHGTWNSVPIVEIESDPLLGMVMMQGCRLNIDVVDGGSVEISPPA
jgi:clan AA aspartic protease